MDGNIFTSYSRSFIVKCVCFDARNESAKGVVKVKGQPVYLSTALN